jgi:hypothetical protein
MTVGVLQPHNAFWISLTLLRDRPPPRPIPDIARHAIQSRWFSPGDEHPRDPLAVLIERSCGDDAEAGAGHPDAVVPAVCDLRVCPTPAMWTSGISRVLLNAQSLSAPRTCNVRLPSAIERSTTVALLQDHSSLTAHSLDGLCVVSLLVLRPSTR